MIPAKTILLIIAVFLVQGIGCRGQSNPNTKTKTGKTVGGPFENREFIYYGIPKLISARDTSPGWKLNGTRLLLTGTIYKNDGRTPAPGVLLYYYQTNPEGRYVHMKNEPRSMPPNNLGQTHGYIRGWVKTDSAGKYFIYTIRPGVYPTRDDPAHIHATIKEPNEINEYYIDDFVFDDDDLLTASRRQKLENRCGSGILSLVKKDGLMVGERNIILGLNIPDYPKEGKTYAWTKILDSADWKKSYNFQMFSINGQLWTFHPDGNWYSNDGVSWTRSSLSNAINNLAFLDYVYFNRAIYGLGNFSGNIEKFSFKPEVYRSSDLKHWDTIAGHSDLPSRFFYHPFVFRNKIWIIGGEDQDTQYSDIWNSDDGVYWVKLKEGLPFGKRSGSQVVALRDSLYLLNNDVWRSADGLNWQLVAREILKGEELFGYSAQVMDDKIWLLGCNRNGEFSSRVLYSSDGISWQAHEAPWLPRGGIAAAVHNNKIFMTGGKYGGTRDHPDFRYDNDVWMLEKK